MTQPGSYADWLVAGATPRLQAGSGTPWLTGWGIVADALQSAAVAATAARLPGSAPIGGLDKIGETLSLIRCRVREPVESDEHYAGRLKRPFSAWVQLGTEAALYDLCTLLALPNVTVHDRKTWTMPRRTDVVIHVRQPHPWAGPRKVGSGWKVGDGTVVGITGITATQAGNMKRLFRPFIPEHCRANVKITFSGVVVGGGWKVGDGTKIGGSAANIWIKG